MVFFESVCDTYKFLSYSNPRLIKPVCNTYKFLSYSNPRDVLRLQPLLVARDVDVHDLALRQLLRRQVQRLKSTVKFQISVLAGTKNLNFAHIVRRALVRQVYRLDLHDEVGLHVVRVRQHRLAVRVRVPRL